MSQFTIAIAGPDVEALEAELQGFLREELGQEGRRMEPSALEEAGVRGDGMQAMQVILMIPISALAIVNLNDRLHILGKIRKLLARVRGKDKGGNQVILASPSDSIELPRAEESEVMEIIASASNPQSDA